MKRLLALALFVLPGMGVAQSLFMADLAGDRELPLTWGVGGNFFTMDQDYDIASLDFNLPGVVLSDPSIIDVRNEVWHLDAQLDVWVLPFLDLFLVAGIIDGNTSVDLSAVPLPLPFPIGTLPIDYDGESYGGGATLAFGGDRWFTTLTATFTNTSLSGDFDSSVDAFTVQPRVGLIRGPWSYWLGGMYLDAEETHRGEIELPFLGPVDFDVILEEQNQWNYALGVRHQFNKKFDLSLELGFGDRDHTLLYAGYRF
jgi:hypothetical protein